MALQIVKIALAAVVATFLLFWFWHIVGCLARKDFKPVDKFFWFAVLLIPILGIMLYRGFAREFYKKKKRAS